MLEIDADDLNADLVAIQYGLHQRPDARTDLIALLGERQIHLHFADDFAHRGLGSLNHRRRRILTLEQIGARVAQTVLDGKLDLDNVLVFGQHRRIAKPGGLDHHIAADIDRTNLRHHDDFMALNRIRQTPVKARANR